jgi:hypothetical protein
VYKWYRGIIRSFYLGGINKIYDFFISIFLFPSGDMTNSFQISNGNFHVKFQK